MSTAADTPQPGSPQSIFEIRGLVTGLAGPPRVELDPFLDAASRCFARFGIRHTSVQDVARELGVDRTTVYRQIGTIDQQVRLLAARDLHRLLASLPQQIMLPIDTAGLIEATAWVIDELRGHPVVKKVLDDDTDTITMGFLNDLPSLLAEAAGVLAPMLKVAMDAGTIAQRDPEILAEWLVRLVVTLVFVPPLVDLRGFLHELLHPALQP